LAIFLSKETVPNQRAEAVPALSNLPSSSDNWREIPAVYKLETDDTPLCKEWVP